MTRIIGGSAGGRTIRTPTGDATRPTTDRVREALFSVLQSRVGSLQGLTVLDLYAGSGAIGLEAASRGATRVILVEKDRRTAGLVRRNAADLGLEVTVVAAPVARFLAGGPDAASPPVDVVFADPPYPLASSDVAADLTALAGWLAPTALVVVERSARDRTWAWPDGYDEVDRRRYGETVLLLAQPADPAEPAEDAGPR
ncbi:16S rRNA (guanine(966)-N(2))-methyltransferase RsmD [Nocardioides sp. HDW12B]|uniref:16S rRNA (guanine(966)-N(2))-methyltransferase RsmD n=1 Tax=Nocardioides sp. HDW12B TaxID=2714939 RepID=UPI00140C9156|nr:16S rRNA (guanine(966)-N(2))-methyltransferase RsmD [Nocardioides sp. HDW12B]QIK67001.1 16S rRNA (guanine(966)-N(2))-methyltransferase RsmD [Nocardioides sp. HDW12B]